MTRLGRGERCANALRQEEACGVSKSQNRMSGEKIGERESQMAMRGPDHTRLCRLL